MKYITIPKAGLRISVVGLGFWQVGSFLWAGKRIEFDKIKEIIRNAYFHGINFYDTAEIYGWGRSEEIMGKVIKELGIRDKIVITSKIAGFRHSYNDMVKSVKNMIKRLGSYPDIILHHWPPPVYVNICKVVNNLEKIVKLGLAHYYGLSNYGEDLIEKVLTCTKKYEPVINQLHYNLGYRVLENKLEDVLKREKITIVAWSPLAKGALAGLSKPKTIIQKTDRVFKTVARDRQLQDKLRDLSIKYGVKQSTIALAWIISNNAIPIPGTRRPERIKEYSLAGEISLDEKDVEELDRISARYKTLWGRKYNALKTQMYIPGLLQKIAIWLIGGI